MKKVVILGNGPSIKFIKLQENKNTTFIGTNNIYLKKGFLALKNQYYTAYDNRFLKKKDWLNFINSFKGNIFFPKRWQFNNHFKNNSKKINFLITKFNLEKSNIIKRFKKKYCGSKDLEGTVLIEMALPLAIALGAKKIFLYGCELNYNMTDDNLNYNSYFYKNNNNNEYFDHDKKSSLKWSQIQVKKIKNINLFLKSYDIKIIDFSLYGRLSFLRDIDENSLYF